VVVAEVGAAGRHFAHGQHVAHRSGCYHAQLVVVAAEVGRLVDGRHEWNKAAAGRCVTHKSDCRHALLLAAGCLTNCRCEVHIDFVVVGCSVTRTRGLRHAPCSGLQLADGLHAKHTSGYRHAMQRDQTLMAGLCAMRRRDRHPVHQKSLAVV